MKYLAAYALCSLKGETPSEKDIIRVLEAAGTEVDAERVKHIVSELQGKDLQSLISQGSTKLQSFAVGGGSAPSAAPAGKASAGAPQAAAKEAAPEEEEDEDMGLGLFD
eukprot:CAMPEP_0201521566 /NCGR_PEP_ID=MMETSP0161_2-20130828/14894_1 /ASSEMBLY_ACC=CAM_ASM_000251 /TAXON_ID=180227 /ORGANISM="Neoparamoeba aestuarina, Strain SoJaBio B1-5/56/2" /LENGTH=108 /DNA_ID=CAMNT_0047920221 /DNA_START=43 /DNA_END=369 /DNA_ORIENTATION=+